MKSSAKFGEVEAALAELHAIASEKRTAFQARLKNFQRLGLLDDAKAGRGKAAAFEAQHVLVLGLAVELTQLGVAPERVRDMISASVGHIAVGVMDAMTPLPDALTSSLFCMVPTASLEDLSRYKDSTLGLRVVKADSLADILTVVGRHPAGSFRLSVFSLSELIVRLPEILYRTDVEKVRLFWSSLKAWASAVAAKHSNEMMELRMEQDGTKPVFDLLRSGKLELAKTYALEHGMEWLWDQLEPAIPTPTRSTTPRFLGRGVLDNG